MAEMVERPKNHLLAPGGSGAKMGTMSFVRVLSADEYAAGNQTGKAGITERQRPARAPMKRGHWVLSGCLVGVATLGAAGGFLVQHGFSARDEPTAVEAFAARRLRHLSVPRAQRDARNPVPLTPQGLDGARAHFADHCALCHGNDGKGQTTLGRNLYPKAPDMTQPDTQALTDGEIFYLIKNGIRLTGMPAWGQDTPEDDQQTWELVHFIRRLPRLTEPELAEMQELNPKTREAWEEEAETRRFLTGGDVPGAPPKPLAMREVEHAQMVRRYDSRGDGSVSRGARGS